MAGDGMKLHFPGAALVTGAGGTGIGAAVAKQFVRAGCRRIFLTDINIDSLAQCKEAIEAECEDPSLQVCCSVGDVSDEAFVDELAGEAFATFDQIDYAVNCAGILGPALKTDETPIELFDKINNINYKGSWLVNRQVLERMKNQKPLPAHPLQRGAIVNIASQLGIVGRPAAAPYCGSKAAVIQMTKCDAIDYSEDSIRVNCVCPGVIATPMTTSTEELKERLKPAVDIAPMRRMGKPEEIANAVLFLCSGSASFIQGHALVVDGGYTIN